MADSKKEATKAAPAPTGKGAAAKAVSEPKKKGKAPPVEKKPSKVAVKKPSKVAVKEVAKDGPVTKSKKTRRGGIGKRDRKSRAARKIQKTEAHAALKRAAAASKDGPPEKKRRAHREIASGVMKFSRPYKYHKKGSWKFTGKRIKKVVPKKPRTIKKAIGGEKNGGFRIVLLKKRRNNYPTADRIKKRRARGMFKKHIRYTRKTLKPGTVCILLTGIHKGKRVVLLKVLKSGLLLINGPFSINGVPLRRVSQNFVIATRTRFNFKDVVIPKHLNDKYFKRIRPKKSKKEEGDIFTTKKEKYVPSEQRKKDQKVMDEVVLNAIQKFKKREIQPNMIIKYLKSTFGLRRNQNPHTMKF